MLLNLNLWGFLNTKDNRWISEKAILFCNIVALELQTKKDVLSTEINIGFFVFTERKRDRNAT